MAIMKGQGIGTGTIKDLCQHDNEARQLISDELTKKPGGNNNPEGIGGKSHKEAIVNTDIISNDKPRNEQHGTSLDYTLRRLRKESPMLHEKVLSGEITANQAAIEVGFRKPQDLDRPQANRRGITATSGKSYRK